MTDAFTPEIELEANTLNILNFVDFRKFLVENKVIVTIVSFTIATYMNELVKSFFDDLLFCFLAEDCKNKDMIKIFQFELEIFGFRLKIGKLLLSLFKFVMAAILVFIISRALNDFIN